MTKQYQITTVIAALAAIGLTACSSNSPTSTSNSSAGMTMSGPAAVAASASGPHNSADIAFATDMIPHHRQAVQMADSAPAKATNAQLKSLATTIKGDQDPEIVRMSGG